MSCSVSLHQRLSVLHTQTHRYPYGIMGEKFLSFHPSALCTLLIKLLTVSNLWLMQYHRRVHYWIYFLLIGGQTERSHLCIKTFAPLSSRMPSAGRRGERGGCEMGQWEYEALQNGFCESQLSKATNLLPPPACLTLLRTR